MLIKLVELHPALVWFLFSDMACLNTYVAGGDGDVHYAKRGDQYLHCCFRMGLDQDYAVETVAVATVFSALTLPFWMKFIGI